MSKLQGRKVKLIRVHTAVHVEGLGQLGGNNLPVALGAKNAVFEMTVVDDGIFLTGKSAQNISFEVLVPFTMCQTIQLLPEN